MATQTGKSMNKNTTYRTIMKALARGEYASVYWLEGEEPFFVEEIIKTISQQVLPPQEQKLAQQVLYGKDVKLLELLHQARQFPMGASKRVLIVKEAQQMTDLAAKKSQKAFIRYLQQPARFTILAFAGTASAAPGALTQALRDHACLLRTRKLHERELIAWLTEQAKSMQLMLSEKALFMLLENIGNDLHKMAHTLAILRVNHKENESINDEKVQHYTGFSRQYSFFELQKALGTRDRSGLYKIMDHMANDPKNYPPLRIVNSLLDYFLKLLKYRVHDGGYKQDMAAELGVRPYFLDEYRKAAKNYPMRRLLRCITALHQADLAIKGWVASSGTGVIRALLYQLSRE